MIGYRQYCKGLTFETGGQGIQLGRFHFDAEYAVFGPKFPDLVIVIKYIRGHNRTHEWLNAEDFGFIVCGFEQIEAGRRSKVAPAETVCVYRRIGTGTNGENDIPESGFFLNRSGGSHTDGFL